MEKAGPCPTGGSVPACPSSRLSNSSPVDLGKRQQWPKSIHTRPREGTWHLQQADCTSFSVFYAGVDPWPALPQLTRTLPRKGLPCPKLLLHSYGSHVLSQSCATLCDPMGSSPSGSSVCGDSPGKNTGVGCLALLQEIFSPQGSTPGLPPCRWVLSGLSPEGVMGAHKPIPPLASALGPFVPWLEDRKVQHLSSVISFPIVTAI